MNRLWRLLHHLFGEPPPPRPTGHVPDGLHRGRNRRRSQNNDQASHELPDDGRPGGHPPDHHTHHGH